MSLEKEQKRMALLQKRLELDLELLRAEKQNTRRAAQVATQSQNTIVMKLEAALQNEKRAHEQELEKVREQLQREQENHAMQLLEWKLKIQKQQADIEKSQEALETLEIIKQDYATQKDLQHQQIESLRATHLLELKQKDKEYAVLKRQLDDIVAQPPPPPSEDDHVQRYEDEYHAAQLELNRVKEENEVYVEQIRQWQEKCKALEGVKGSLDDDDESSAAASANDLAAGTCQRCEDLEEEMYELKLKLNKRQIEYEKEIQALKERRQTNSGVERTIETVGTAAAAISDNGHSKTAKEMQEIRKLETEKRKTDMKLLALEAKQESIAREKKELEEELTAAKDELYQLALELEQLQKETHKEEDKADNLDVQQLSILKDQIDRFQQSQQTYLERYNEERRELNEIIESLTQKQRQVFDVTLPMLDAKVNEFEKQIGELNQVELAAATAAASLPVPNPSPGAADETGGDTRNIRGPFDRRPPLTKVDSLMNRHVTEFNFVTDKQKGRYTGFLNAMKMPNGHGLLRVDNGDVYEGEWKNGQRHGQGVYNWYDGDLYTGPWFEGKRHGHGVFIFTDGRVYDGEYNMGRREGQGMFVWPYGAKYEGSYHADKRNGYGEYVYPDGRSYQGEYRDDRPHGYGVEKSKDGTVLHDGQWTFGEFLGNDDCVSVAASIAH
jgi:hypothetical protein